MVELKSFTEEDAQKTPEEVFGSIATDEIVNVKEMPYEDKLRFIKYCMNYDGLINSSLLVNIAFIVYSSQISDEVFTDVRIAFSTLEEYVDIKYDLKAEIKAYGTELLKYYLASLKSYDVILPDNKIQIPMSYKAILLTSSAKDISKLMRNYPIDTQSLPLVFDANEIIDHYTLNGSPVVQEFVNYFMENLKK